MVLNDVTSALQPYSDLTDALSGEKQITISAVLPLLDYIEELADGSVNADDEAVPGKSLGFMCGAKS